MCSSEKYIFVEYSIIFILQVTRPYPGDVGCISIANGLILGGDSFTHSNVSECLRSAELIAEEVANYFGR